MTHYEILGVNWKATSEEIRKTYLVLVKDCHPDTTDFPTGHDEERVRLLNEAYNVLKNEKTRAAYNRELVRTHRSCTNCGGQGNTYKQKGWGQRLFTRCQPCNGAGLVKK